MTTHYRTKGFVFKKNDRSEADRVFSIFTNDFGRLEVFGKAIRKINSKLKSGIDVLYFSEIEFIQGKNYKTLTDAAVIKKFDDISKDFEKLEIAFKIANILDVFIKGQEKDEKIFFLLNEVLGKLDSGSIKTKNYSLIYYYFIWNFLFGQGYKPEVYKCSACKDKLNPSDIYFSYKEGGVICEKCSEDAKDVKKINSDVVKILRIIFDKKWELISKLKIEPYSNNLLKEISENSISIFCPS